MIDKIASRTALRVALHRAAHQLLDSPPIFADPFAAALLGVTAEQLLADPGLLSPFGRAVRAFVAARSRRTEDRLAVAVAAGVRQYVVLGAGLDTFALRNPFPGLRVFEVDHPATQELKRERISAAQLPAPSALAFVAVDFEQQALAQALEAAGFAAREPAFFSWLGVVPYLEPPVVFETLRFLASVGPSVEVVFDYSVDPSLLTGPERGFLEVSARKVAAAGEPFRSSFFPAQLQAELRRLGFEDLEDFGRQELNSLYCQGRGDGLELRGDVGRLLSARRTAG
ncbi:MAG: class I SAM-dependent methyltransferase [Thermoanaerobaculia bacterium]